MTSPVQMRSGLAALVTGVRAYFEEKDSTAEVVFGYRQVAQQLNQGPGRANRVVFLPGNPNGGAGALAAPRDVGRQTLSEGEGEGAVPVAEVRPLASWERQLTISLWAFDDTAPRDELVQDTAATNLFELFVQALEQVHGAGGPNIAWGGLEWVVPKENTFGAELRITAQLIHPLMDAPLDVGTPGFELHRVGNDPPNAPP